ncbi:hypothetical protein PVAG01_09320 [Phlyctema vagabunda]|uniref:DUF6594 domain-containing protein n=1 Tax=Phlyctema vagabunda TaxID=108571 RepID=A0ABR4P711_9HELO
MSHTPDLEAGILSDHASYHSTASETKPISENTLQSIRMHFGVGAPSPATPLQRQDPEIPSPSPSHISPRNRSLVSPSRQNLIAPEIQSLAPPSGRDVVSPESQDLASPDGPKLMSPPSPAKSDRRGETDELISDWDAVRERLESVGVVSPGISRHELTSEDTPEKTQQRELEAKVSFEAWRVSYVPMQSMRDDWLKNMFLEDILWRGVQLQKQCLIMGSQNMKLTPLQDHVRRDDIHEELCRFSQALLNYDSFVRSPLCEKLKSELLPNDLNHGRSYIRDLAVLESAKFLDKPDERLFVEHLENLLFKLPYSPEVRSHLDSLILPGVRHALSIGLKDFFKDPRPWIIDVWKATPIYKLSLKEWLSRVFVFVFTMVILLAPLALMLMWPGPWHVYMILCVSTFITGIILTVCMDEVTKVDIMATVAAYTAVLVVGMGQAMADRGETVEFED